MPFDKRIPNDRLSLNQRVTFLLEEIRQTPHGEEIILSRNTPEFVKKLFEKEVPEIASGNVVIERIAREAGIRTKIAVRSKEPGIDPVGSCVGQKGVRVQTITNELSGERVDIVAFSEDEKEFIKASLSPVDVLSIKLDKKAKKATVEVPDDQLSIAIGASGQNVRLASMLTDYSIDIQGNKKEEKPEKEEEKKEEVPAVE
jgi:N utilization substance protein A